MEFNLLVLLTHLTPQDIRIPYLVQLYGVGGARVRAILRQIYIEIYSSEEKT